jgi:hypothetical protein
MIEARTHLAEVAKQARLQLAEDYEEELEAKRSAAKFVDPPNEALTNLRAVNDLMSGSVQEYFEETRKELTIFRPWSSILTGGLLNYGELHLSSKGVTWRVSFPYGEAFLPVDTDKLKAQKLSYSDKVALEGLVNIDRVRLVDKIRGEIK